MLLITSVASAALGGTAVHPSDLRCEYLKEPLGLDRPQPRLSWVLQADKSSRRGLRQSAFEVLVASSREQLEANRGDLWSSGKLDSDQ